MIYKGILSKWNFFRSFKGNYESFSGLKFCVFIESYMRIVTIYQDKRLQELYLMSYSDQDAFNYLFRTARSTVLEYRTLKCFGTFRTWRASTSQYSTECGRPCCSAVVSVAFSRQFWLRRCLCVPGTTTVPLPRSPSLSSREKVPRTRTLLHGAIASQQ